MLTVVAPASTTASYDLQQVVDVRAAGVLGGELDLRVATQRLAGVRDPLDGGLERLLAGGPQLVLEVDVAGGDEQVQVRPLGGRAAPPRPAADRRPCSARGRPPRRPWSPSRSAGPPRSHPGEAAGKPASMTSTLRRTSCRATSSFSATVRPAPGACSPSRSVVSKMRMGPAAPAYVLVDRRSCSSVPSCRRPLGGCLRLAGLDLDRVQERHLAAQLGADLLDLVGPVLLAHALEARRRRCPSPRSTGARTGPTGCR